MILPETGKVELSDEISLYPQVHGGGDCTLTGIDAVAAHLDRRVGNPWSITRALRTHIKAHLNGDTREIGLEAGDASVTIPLKEEGSQCVYVDGMDENGEYDLVFTAIIAAPDDRRVDESMDIRVSTKPGEIATMNFFLNAEHGLDLEGIRECLDEVYGKGVAFMEDVLAGQEDPVHGYNPDIEKTAAAN